MDNESEDKEEEEEKNLLRSEIISKGVERPSRSVVAAVKLKVTIMMGRQEKRL
jgi:hypothetical protein